MHLFSVACRSCLITYYQKKEEKNTSLRSGVSSQCAQFQTHSIQRYRVMLQHMDAFHTFGIDSEHRELFSGNSLRQKLSFSLFSRFSLITLKELPNALLWKAVWCTDKFCTGFPAYALNDGSMCTKIWNDQFLVVVSKF